MTNGIIDVIRCKGCRYMLTRLNMCKNGFKQQKIKKLSSVGQLTLHHRVKPKLHIKGLYIITRRKTHKQPINI